jgi:T-complex protein 1 subunit gamma
VEAWPYKAAGQSAEVIPRTLAQNCGANVIRTLTKLRAKHAEAAEAGQPCTFGINGETGGRMGLILPDAGGCAGASGSGVA